MVQENIIIGKPILPSDNQIGPGPNGAPKGPPSGYHSLKTTTKEVGQIARNLLSHNFGTMIPFSVNGINYMARLEPHYHPPGFKGGPNGWHKGVTVYQQASTKKESIKPNNDVIKQIDEYLNKFNMF